MLLMSPDNPYNPNEPLPHDYNCYANATTGAFGTTYPGGRGVTIWGPLTTAVHIPQGTTSDAFVFTCTKPKFYATKDFCNVTFTIHTNASCSNTAAGPITLELRNFSNNDLLDSSDYYHSKVSGHDCTLTIDIAQVPGYVDDGRMFLKFTNNSQVDIWIQGLQIVRGYMMNTLTAQGS